MDYIEHFDSKTCDYKQHLLEDLRVNPRFKNVVNSLFFPSTCDIETWVLETKVKSFRQHWYLGERFVNRFCTREELDNVSFLGGVFEEFERYSLFAYIKCDSYEEAKKRNPGYYHLIREGFYDRMDKIILSALHEYRKGPGSRRKYRKSVGEDIEIVIDTSREDMGFENIISYKPPSVSIQVGKQGSIDIGRFDARSFLFLPPHSYSFFYADSHEFFRREDFQIINVVSKRDEPIIYWLEEEKKYLLSNSWENIDRYNKYIKLILELSFHYFKVFEAWLVDLIRKTHAD